MIEKARDAATDPFTEWRLLAVASVLGRVSQREYSSVAADLVAEGHRGKSLLALASSYGDIAPDLLERLVDASRQETGIVQASKPEAYAFVLCESHTSSTFTESLERYGLKQVSGRFDFWDQVAPNTVVRTCKVLALELDHLLDNWPGVDSGPRRRETLRGDLARLLATTPETSEQQLVRITCAPQAHPESAR